MSDTGLAVLRSELFVVWLPAMVVCAGLLAWRHWAPWRAGLNKGST